jgi:NADH:ubiquinone oxidoreductase subunit 2 (subunit N)
MAPLYAEIFLVIASCAILLIDMFLKEGKRNLTYVLSLLTLVAAPCITYADFSAGTTAYTFHNMFVSDPMANLLKLFTYLAVGMTLVYSRQYADDRGMMSGNMGGEFYVLALFTMLGQMIMISGNNMLPIYLGLELMSLSLYALVAMRRDHAISTEAAMKYFILGSLASGFMLYGISMIYGATGSLDITAIAAARRTAPPTTTSWCSAWCSSSPAWPSSWARCRSTCGCRTSTRARRPRDPAAGRRAEAGFVRDDDPHPGRRPAAAGLRLAADAAGPGRAVAGRSAT